MAATRPLTEAEETAVLAALETFPAVAQGLVRVMMNTGFRIGEILSMDIGSVWSGCQIRERVSVERRNLKGGKGVVRRSVKARTVPINPCAAAALQEYLFALFGSSGPGDPSRPLFLSRKGNRLSRNQAARIIKSIFEEANVATDVRGERGTHVLRKTFCQRIYHACGKDVNVTRAVMNHRNLTTTQCYLHVSQSEMDAAVMAIGMAETAANARQKSPVLGSKHAN